MKPIALALLLLTLPAVGCASAGELRSLAPNGKSLTTTAAPSSSPITEPFDPPVPSQPPINIAQLGTALVAIPTVEFQHGNRIYNVLLVQDGQEVGRIQAISGRPYAQDKDTNTPDIGAPIPAGSYQLGELEPVADNYELGNIWTPAEPEFPTNRTFLGFHHDPSFGQEPYSLTTESGTKGCLATFTEEGKRALIDFANNAQPTRLVVTPYP